MRPGAAKRHVIVDRRDAIAKALEMAGPGDVVVSPARATRRTRCCATAPSPSTTARWRGIPAPPRRAEREEMRAPWPCWHPDPRRRRPRRPGGTAARRRGSPGAALPASPSTRARSRRASSSWPSRARTSTATTSWPRRPRSGARPRSCTATSRRGRAAPRARRRHHAGPRRPRAARAAAGGGPGRGHHRLRGQDHDQGDDGGAPRHARARAQDGRQPQQPVRPAPDPAAPPARAPPPCSSSACPPRASCASCPRIARPDVAVITMVAPCTSSSSRPWTTSRPPRRRSWKACAPTGRPSSTATTRACAASARRSRAASSGSDATAPTTCPPRAGAAPARHALRPARGRAHRRRGPAPAGPHFLANFLAAAAAAHASASPPEAIAEAATPRRRRAPRRGRRLGEGVVLLDDCYNSNPAAVEAAVVALSHLAGARRVAFLGDMLELGADGAGAAPRGGREAGGHASTWSSGWARWPGSWRGRARQACPPLRSHHFADAASGGRARSRTLVSPATPCS